MLLMQEPELLLVDEPVAGMTPQETERTAELLVSLAGEHSVVVVEHDMDFVRSIARRVTVLHEGQRARRRRHGPGAERSARHRGVSGRHERAAGQGPQPVLRRQPHAVGRRSRRAGGLAHLPDGPQRHGQDHAAQVHHGPAAGDVRRRSRSTARDLRALPAEERARLGIGYVPQGREIFPQLTVEENLRIGLGVRKNGPRAIPPRIFDLFPVLKTDAAPARRRSLGRAAAAARHRPRAGARADAADPRRADRRHSAEHRPRNRRHHPAG